jgi:hypothetical protein
MRLSLRAQRSNLSFCESKRKPGIEERLLRCTRKDNRQNPVILPAHQPNLCHIGGYSAKLSFSRRAYHSKQANLSSKLLIAGTLVVGAGFDIYPVKPTIKALSHETYQPRIYP